ncbi:MAG: phosphatidate cytidylyltransferase [Tenericutes bacterium]|jgi:phosphatidate cytidylyltransferase|nr:phosphatidate cytidylyltransferase [Mycoplasmatota bacterium]
MKTRIITALILILAFGFILIIGEGSLSFLFSGGVVLLATVAAYEFMIKLHRHGLDKYWFHYLPIGLTFAFVLLNVLYFGSLQYERIMYLYLLALAFIYFIIYLIEQRMDRQELGVSMMTIFYTSIGFIALVYLRRINLEMVLYLLVITIFTDTFAYFIGIKFGKHKLMPKVSPKKSIEGAIAGLVFGGALGTLFAVYFNVFDFHIIFIILLSIAISIVSQSGDLIASKFKREQGIKDYSNIFPGHGGVLDRFDSTMFAAAFLMLVLQVI